MFEHQSPIEGAAPQARRLRARMTSSEQKLWNELRKLDANFRRQAPIGPYFADFAAYGSKLVIEVDGGVHERLAEVQLRDFERQQWLENEGFKLIRFTDRQVFEDVYGCVEQIALLLEGGGLGGGASAELTGGREWAPTPNGASDVTALHTPPSPTLPPSRRKGDASFNGGAE
jgi:very-short-patch-repair endonuclease